MNHTSLQNFTDIYLPILGLFIFLTIFIGVCIWVFRRESTQVYKEAEQLPFIKE